MLKICIEIHNFRMMKEGELKSLGFQIKLIYADNQNRTHKSHLIIANYHQIENYLIKNHINWNIHFVNNSILDYLLNTSVEEMPFALMNSLTIHNEIKDCCIYLSSDAEEELEKLEEDKIYIIGGLVDRNRHKDYIRGYAMNLGIRSYKLPIRKYLKLNSSTVLTTNQIFTILMDFHETMDWKEALLKNIPKRKILEIIENN